MAKTASNTETPAQSEVKKRTILSPQERIEKARAEVAKLEAKVQASAKAKLDANAEALVTASKRVEKAQAKVDALTKERAALKQQAGEEPEPEAEVSTES